MEIIAAIFANQWHPALRYSDTDTHCVRFGDVGKCFTPPAVMIPELVLLPVRKSCGEGVLRIYCVSGRALSPLYVLPSHP